MRGKSYQLRRKEKKMSDGARENKDMTLKAVEELFRKRRADISSKVCKNYI